MEALGISLKKINLEKKYEHWISVCNEIKRLLADTDQNSISQMMEKISEDVPPGAVVTTDVGQNQVWTAQSFRLKEGQKVLFSGGHGSSRGRQSHCRDRKRA